MQNPINEVQVKSFRNGGSYKGVLGLIQDSKTIRGREILWKKHFTDNNGVDGHNYQIMVPFDSEIDGEIIQERLYLDLVVRGAVDDKAEKLKLKPGDRIRFTGRYSARKGDVKWFFAFEVRHPNHLEKLKKSDDSAI